MCYSALVKQEAKNLGLSFHVKMDEQLTFDLFVKRSEGENIRIPKAFEQNFKNPNTPFEKKVSKLIETYRTEKISELEADLFKQKNRLYLATESLKKKQTKKALNDIEVSGRQIDRIQKRLEKIKDTKIRENDSRIYAFYYAPIIIMEKGKRKLVPMRYHLRPPGMKADFDRKYPGCYNARRDSLAEFWKKEFGSFHGVVILEAFFENVAKHDFEKRNLRKGETEENIVLKFEPKGMDYMVVPVIWDVWTNGKEKLYSFALITDEPPVEVLETGHDRCPIFLNEERIDDWLEPKGMINEAYLCKNVQLLAILTITMT
tara:strand:+ start:17668 stop:18618 length:951 start_codon:yes stop_codon:yes gene_type:complete